MRKPAPRSLSALVREGAPLSEIAQASDELPSEARIAQVRALSGGDLKALYQRAEGGLPLTLEFLVPAHLPKGASVEFVGLNSLPAFSAFSKHFCRGEAEGTLSGRNSGAWEWATGPGYFTVRARPGVPSELLFDYTVLPTAAPAGWPPVRRNERFISYFVFAGMHDYFRAVGRHLGIGAAHNRHGRFKGQYFALARGPVTTP
jgi:hypothetical protein